MPRTNFRRPRHGKPCYFWRGRLWPPGDEVLPFVRTLEAELAGYGSIRYAASMKRIASILLTALLLVGCNFEINIGDQAGEVLSDPGPEKERAESFAYAAEFLSSLDRDEDTYSLAAPFLRESTPEAVWNTGIAGLRSWVGDIKERKADVYGYTESLEDAPPGRYFVIQYVSQFSNGTADEKVVVSFDSTGYQIAGYHLYRTWSTSSD